mmetsp:Transcript_75343/g.162968  ORF Transcript_75343/g.162968 Transcript_75343/m.162968 type:complete len:271 (+) Transcript_75343:589-1401(+)
MACFSIANSTSLYSANAFFWNTEWSSASLTMFAMSAPLLPVVSLANMSIFLYVSSENFPFFMYNSKRAFLPLTSGKFTLTVLSNLPGLNSAWSSAEIRLVAPIIKIWSFLLNPSIWLSISLRLWRAELDSDEDRVPPNASISSTKMMQGLFSRASLNNARTLLAPTPTYISSKLLPLTLMKLYLVSPANALAIKVFPVPGFPCSNRPLGSLHPLAVNSVLSSRNNFISFKSSKISSIPFKSSNLVFSSVTISNSKLLTPKRLKPPIPPPD